MIMVTELSILIPIFNDDASRLVDAVYRQAQAIEGLRYEIVVFDDGSTDEAMIALNHSLERYSCCRYVRMEHSKCRAAMRNKMSSVGRYEWHLMIDARLTLVYDDFLKRYVNSDVLPGEAVCGGVCVCGGADEATLYRQNLRFRYEKYEETTHSAAERTRNPYNAFRTTNFFYHRTVLQRVAYDERIIGYGYEDVMLGKCLQRAGVRVLHIDNPVAYTSFESNTRYLEKLEEALRTLHEFAPELIDYSPLLRAIHKLNSCCLLWALRCLYKLFGTSVRKLLSGSHPKLFILKIYKLGYYASLG